MPCGDCDGHDRVAENMNRIRGILFGLTLGLLLGLGASSVARAGSGPYQTLVVINSASRNSRLLGLYYAERHGLPKANICLIRTKTSGASLSREAFEMEVRRPISEHIEREGLTGQIHFVVLSLDIPTRVNNDNGLSSVLFYGYKEKTPNAPQCNIAPDSVNQYYAAERAYRSTAGWNRTNAPIVFFLTAADLATAKEVVDRGVASLTTPPPTNALFCLYGTGDAARNVRHRTYERAANPFALFGAADAVDVRLTSGGVPARPMAAYMTGRPSLSTNFLAMQWIPGAIADHLTSCAGMIPDPCSNQSTVWDWMRLGVTASYGTVTEPCAFEAKFPDPMLHFWYWRGFTAGEALAMSVKNPYQGIFAGDPLAAPFAKPPTIQVLTPEPDLRTNGIVNLALSMRAHPEGAPPVYLDLYVDGKFVCPITRPLSPTGNELIVNVGTETFSYTIAPGEDLYRATAGLAWAVNSRGHGKITAKAFSDRLELTVKQPLDEHGAPLPFSATAERGFGKSLYIGMRAGTPHLIIDTKTGEGHAALTCHLGQAMNYAFEYPLNLSALAPGRHMIGLVVRDGTAMQCQSQTEWPVVVTGN